MNPVTAAVVFIVIWWVTLFAVLPWGVSRTENPETGHDTGAPARPMLGRKILITTGITIAIFTVFYVVADSGAISLQELSERFNIY